MKHLVAAAAIAWGSGQHEATAAPTPVPAPDREAAPDRTPAPAPAASAEAVDAASAASPVWKPGPSIQLTGDKVDGAALRARHRRQLAADRSPVTVLTGGTAAELGKRLCEAVVPRRPPDTPVLLKPNLGGFNWFRDPKKTSGDDGVKGRITDPAFVRGVIACLKARGHTRITIADGFTGKAADWVRLARVSGYGEMARQEGVSLVALDDDGVFDVEGDQPGKPLGLTGMERTGVPTLLIPKVLAEHLDHGLTISLPKIKAHRFAVFSIGIKAMQGSTMYSDASPAFTQKWRSHREIDHALKLIAAHDPKARQVYVRALERFAERMADVLEIEAPDVVLAEGAPAMSGDGFTRLFPSPENVAIGGSNAILVDRVAAQYLGFWNNAALAAELGGHATSPLLEVAAKRFGVDIANPKVAGDGARLLAVPRPSRLIAMAGFELSGELPAPPAPPAPPVPPVPPVPGDAPAHATELHARYTPRPPAIDGQIDAIWSTAPPLRFTTDWAGRATAIPTQVRALWSPGGLYFLWELDAITTFTDRTRPIDVERIDLYEENCVELFLVPDPANRQRYFEIELGPFGHFFDLLVDRTRKPRSDNAWSAQLRIGTARDEARQHAVIEVSIASPDVLAGLSASAARPIGLYRMEGQGQRHYLAAFPTRTPRPNFHVPAAFGTLVFDP